MQKFDRLKWLVAFFLLIAGFIANYWYITAPLPLRIVGWLILACAICATLFRTVKGRKCWLFIKEARNELQRIAWPNRKETIQTTIMVFVMVVVLALILWGLDSLLIWLIGLFTSRGG